MEFRFRDKDERGLPSNSILPSIAFSDRALQVGSVGYTGLKDLLPEGRSMEELERILQEEKIRGEILAQRLMQRRMLEEEAKRNFELKNKMPSNPTEDHQSGLLLDDISANVAQGLPSSPVIEAIKETPMEITTSFKDSAGEKRRCDTTFEETREVKHQKINKEWSCALCHISATCEDGFNDHIKGQIHLDNVLKLGHVSKKATEDSNCDNASNDNASDIQKKKGPDGGELNCTVCGVTVTSKFALTEHMKGKKHLAKVVKSSGDTSLNGKAINTSEKQITLANSKNRVRDAVKEKDFCCMVCNVKCFSEAVLASHLKGKRHMAIARKMLPASVTEEKEKSHSEIKLPEQNAACDKENILPPLANNDLICSLCDVRVTSNFALEEHLKGRKHMANVMKHNPTSKKEKENSNSNGFSSNGKAINTPESKENVESGEIHDTEKEKFSTAEDVVSNVEKKFC